MVYVGYAAKAIFATVTAFLASLATVLVGNASLSDVTAGQWVTAALAALVAGGGVFGIQNSVLPKKKKTV